MGKIVFVTGPVRSGKSRFALDMALGWGGMGVYVATYQVDPTDQEMADRVRRHQAERPDTWRTLEAPGDVAQALLALDPVPSGVMMDCLTLWLAWRMEASDEAILEDWMAQLEAFRRAPWPLVIVGNEVGWSPVPADPATRRFRDLAGWLAQATTRVADEAWLAVAGCQIRLK
nr:bifunctional adenosylcobinamide kinase/adenosylcobinamide-phosphate guanylyltransferase [uncultured Holophaga sp.]